MPPYAEWLRVLWAYLSVSFLCAAIIIDELRRPQEMAIMNLVGADHGDSLRASGALGLLQATPQDDEAAPLYQSIIACLSAPEYS